MCTLMACGKLMYTHTHTLAFVYFIFYFIYLFIYFYFIYFLFYFVVSRTASRTASPPVISAPYVEPPLSCPNVTDSVGLCVMDLACTGNTNRTCDPGKLCCFNGCSPVCTTGITPTPLCPAVKLKATNGTSGLLGVYVPQCKENGEFSQIQCHEGYCWCVDRQTGKATTQPSRSQPVCNTTTTTSQGKCSPQACVPHFRSYL